MIGLIRLVLLFVLFGMFLFSFTSTLAASEEYGSEEQEIVTSEEDILAPEESAIEEEEGDLEEEVEEEIGR